MEHVSEYAVCPVRVSVLFNEPKLLKFNADYAAMEQRIGFSALQRAEIAEIADLHAAAKRLKRFSALQRAEIAEMLSAPAPQHRRVGFQCSSTSRNC